MGDLYLVRHGQAAGLSLRVTDEAGEPLAASACRTVERDLSMDCPETFDCCRNPNQVCRSYFTPEGYRNLHGILGNPKLFVTLTSRPEVLP